MLDYRSKTKARNYLDRGVQRRFLILAGLVTLVFLVGSEATRHEGGSWLSALSRPAGGPNAREFVDTRLHPTPNSEPTDVAIRIEPAEKPAASVGARLLPGVQPKWLANIRDDMHLRSHERDAYYGLLELLSATSRADIARHTHSSTGYVQLFRQTADYRGELVALDGTIRQAIYHRAPANEYKIQGFYRLVLQPTDHPTGLIFVDCLDLPTGFPMGESIRAEVRVAGLCFKRWAYQAQDDIRTAPLVLAKTVDWQTTESSVAATVDWNALGMGAALALVASVVVVMFVIRRTPRAARSVASSVDEARAVATLARLARDSQPAPPALSSGASSPSPGGET